MEKLLSNFCVGCDIICWSIEISYFIPAEYRSMSIGALLPCTDCLRRIALLAAVLLRYTSRGGRFSITSKPACGVDLYAPGMSMQATTFQRRGDSTSPCGVPLLMNP